MDEEVKALKQRTQKNAQGCLGPITFPSKKKKKEWEGGSLSQKKENTKERKFSHLFSGSRTPLQFR